MCKDEFSQSECQHVTNTLPLPLCSPLRAVAHCATVSLRGLPVPFTMAGAKSCTCFFHGYTALRPQVSQEQAAQASPLLAHHFKRMESQLLRQIFTTGMQGHDLVLCTTEFHSLKTLQFTFYAVSDFSYIESVS